MQGNFGIVVSGGPAPGINAVISSVTIEAYHHGAKVLGLREGFRGIGLGLPDAIMELELKAVSSIAGTGGSILGTSRFNPLAHDDTKERFFSTLEAHKIDKLIVIGGDGSAYLSSQIQKLDRGIRVAHIPKTIDNDLILPNQSPSFGFETARYAGAKIVDTLMVDARTTGRWFIVTSMGRRAGFLALGLGLASGATITIIPEEFPERVALDQIADSIYNSILHRKEMGRNYGIALLAEGVLDRIDPQSSPALSSLPHDDLGRIHYAEVELGDLIAQRVRPRCKKSGLPDAITTKNIGYELRCHPPISFDIEYTRFLGVGAVRYLLEGKGGIMVCRDYDKLTFQRLEDLIGPDGTIKSRVVDLKSDMYQIARSFMVR